MREFLTTEAGILRQGNPSFRSNIGLLLSSWETAQLRGTKRKAEEAEQLAGGLPPQLSQQEHLSMIKGYNKAHRELDDRRIPAPC